MNEKEMNKEIKLAINKLYNLSQKSRGNIIRLTQKHEYKLKVILATFIRNTNEVK